VGEQLARPPRSCAFQLGAFIVAIVGGCMLFVQYVRYAQIEALGQPVPRLLIAPLSSSVNAADVEALRPHVESRLAYLLGRAPRAVAASPEGLRVSLPERLDPAEVARASRALGIRGDIKMCWVVQSGGTERKHRDTSEVIRVDESQVVVANEDLAEVKRGKDVMHRPALELVFTPQGSDKFFGATSQNVNRQLAILLDDEVVTAPVVRAGIRERCVIDGGGKGFSEADVLALLVAMGSKDRYPFPVRVSEIDK
jgi:preprotein translocase subunit SecD